MAIKCGTWKFKYRFPDGNTGHYGFSVNYNWSSSINRNCYYGKCSDMHHHCCVYVRPECAFSFDYDGTGWPEDGKWHQVTIIRTPDTWVYVYNDYIFEFYVEDKLDFTPEKILLTLSRYEGHTMYIDNLEIYRDKYLFPETEIAHKSYTWNYYYNTGDGCFYPETREGIVVKGRNIRLAEIAAAVNDPAKFTYNGNTAICYVDLVIYEGSEFLMNNETLKFHGDFDGECHLVLKYGAEMSIENSVVTTTNDHYFVWNNAGSTTHFGRATSPERADPIEFQKVGFSGGVWPLGNAGLIRFSADNSIINNTAHIFFDSPMELNITNTKFTNLHELDIGNYTGVATTGQRRSRQRWFPNGDKSFWVYLDEVNTNKFNFSGVSFSGQESPINVTFLINALRDKLNVYDMNLENENIVIKKTLPQQAGQSHTWEPYVAASYESESYGGEGTGMDSKLGLVNCKFKEIVVPTDKAWAIPKYYLDVKVVNQAGQPESGATVTITNEVDNTDYPSENIEVKQQVFDPKPSSANQYFYLSYQLIQGLPHTSAVTGANGHTPLPSDKSQTLVIADYVKAQAEKREFTYTVKVEKNGVVGTVRRINPDAGWYRPDSDIPAQTIVVVLGVLDVPPDLKSVKVYPNPFNPEWHTQGLTIDNLTAQAGIKIFTVAGELVRILQEREGYGRVTWDGRNESGRRVANGIYIGLLESPGGETRRVKIAVEK